MIFLDPLFPVFALATVLAAQWRGQGLAPAALALGFDVAFMALFLGAAQAGILAAFALCGYAALHVAARGRLAVAVAALVALFVVLKKYTFLPDALRIDALPVAVGLSYVLFRVVHLTIDTAQGATDRPRLDAFLHYALHYPALLSGPFQPYGDHRAALVSAARVDPLPQLARMGDGFLKVVILAPLLRGLHVAIAPAHAAGPWALAMTVAAALVWVAFMYFNFSGYMDIVVPWARLCRVDLPENFDRPWRANSFLDFWARWHMTMTGWFRTYVFGQLLVGYGRRFPDRRVTVAVSGGAFFLTFLLVGAWHGPNWPFLACGLLLAAGATANQVTRELLRKRRGGKPAAPPAPLVLFGAGATFCYIALAVMPFWARPPQFAAFLHAALQPAALIVLPAACALAGLLLLPLRAVMSGLEALGTRFAGALHSAPAVAARATFLALYLLSTTQALPDFVYKGI